MPKGLKIAFFDVLITRFDFSKMNSFAILCGIVGSALYLVYFLGGQKDNDGQGVNMPANK